jgi:hypothetical protein
MYQAQLINTEISNDKIKTESINKIEHICMYLVVEGISIPILMLCLSSLWQLHTGGSWYFTLTWFSHYTASTLLGNTSHTTMYHDTIIVLEHSFRYRKSIYYSLVTLSKSSYLYIDFAICLQYGYKLAIHKY